MPLFRVGGWQQAGRARASRRMSVPAGIAATAAFTVAVAACGGGMMHPTVLTNGSPPGRTTYGGIIVNPGGVADYSVTVQNIGSAPVTLLSAKLLPIPGFQAPRLVHAAVLVEHQTLLGAGRGWPPEADSASHRLETVPLKGYAVAPWKTRKQHHIGPLPDILVFGVTGTAVNQDYAAAGLTITYRLDNAIHTQKIYVGAITCVLNVNINDSHSRNALYGKYCAANDNEAIKAVDRLAAEASR